MHALEPGGQGERVAVVAAGRDAVAAGDWVPGRLGPLDGAVGAHRSTSFPRSRSCWRSGATSTKRRSVVARPSPSLVASCRSQSLVAWSRLVASRSWSGADGWSGDLAASRSWWSRGRVVGPLQGGCRTSTSHGDGLVVGEVTLDLAEGTLGVAGGHAQLAGDLGGHDHPAQVQLAHPLVGRPTARLVARGRPAGGMAGGWSPLAWRA
jgi:hypothetical protein